MVISSKQSLRREDKSRITALFKQFGCNEREANIYLRLLQLGPVSVQELSRALKQNRVTVHSAVEQLINKGFLYETRRGKRRLIAAENPKALHQLLQKKENEIALMRTNMDYVSQVLARLEEHDRSMPTVKFYEGVDGLKRMLEETLETKTEMLIFSYVERLAYLLIPDYLENFFVRRSKKGIHTRLIFPPCSFANRVNKKAEQYKIQIRLLPEHYEWKSGIFAWDNKLSILSYTEGKVTCTTIENEDIAYFYRNVIFDLCWQMAKPM